MSGNIGAVMQVAGTAITEIDSVMQSIVKVFDTCGLLINIAGPHRVVSVVRPMVCSDQVGGKTYRKARSPDTRLSLRQLSIAVSDQRIAQRDFPRRRATHGISPNRKGKLSQRLQGCLRYCSVCRGGQSKK